MFYVVFIAKFLSPSTSFIDLLVHSFNFISFVRQLYPFFCLNIFMWWYKNIKEQQKKNPTQENNFYLFIFITAREWTRIRFCYFVRYVRKTNFVSAVTHAWLKTVTAQSLLVKYAYWISIPALLRVDNCCCANVIMSWSFNIFSLKFYVVIREFFLWWNQHGSGEEWAQAFNSITEMKLPQWVELIHNIKKLSLEDARNFLTAA